ncbi:hypothetical protein [Olegusella massiliensis]|uniref:hypothetical protein n=1 Tax=Olegusella massiliensis TaxID=1776381 RepID=UPI00083898E2|nr:hypothetical protein [Olegusella massiliensis]
MSATRIFPPNHLDPVVLFDNPNASYRDATPLNDSLANYSDILIDFCTVGGLSSSTRVHNPDGKTVPLSTVIVGSNKKLYTRAKAVVLRGNRISTFKDSGGWVTGSAANIDVSTDDSVAITRVVGWRK